MKLLTRKDAGLGVGLFDSVAWAFEVHLKEPDNPLFKSAVLHGNEDCPDRIEFYARSMPLVTSKPAMVWERK